MSDRPIQVGDLVQVVLPTPCCGKLGKLYGTMFTVSGFRTSYGRCAQCNLPGPRLVAEGHSNRTFSVVRLKRIPPLSELEGERTQEKLKETA